MIMGNACPERMCIELYASRQTELLRVYEIYSSRSSDDELSISVVEFVLRNLEVEGSGTFADTASYIFNQQGNSKAQMDKNSQIS